MGITLHRVRYDRNDYLSGRRDGNHYPEHVTHAWTYRSDGRDSYNYFSTKLQAARAAYPLAAWPGGYAMEYTDGSMLFCGACAARDAVNGNAANLDGGTIEEAEQDIICEGCGRLILAQNLCPEHGYQPDAIMDRDEPGAYRCPMCDADDPAFTKRCDHCGIAQGDVPWSDDPDLCDHCNATIDALAARMRAGA